MELGFNFPDMVHFSPIGWEYGAVRWIDVALDIMCQEVICGLLNIGYLSAQITSCTLSAAAA
jgi:hypothetical protein